MFIEVGELNIKLLILLVYPIGIIISRLRNYYFTNNPYFFLFIFFLSHYLILLIKFFYIAKDHCSKIKDNKDKMLTKRQYLNTSSLFTNKINGIYLIPKGKKSKKGITMRLIFIGILYFISYVFFYYSNFINTTTFYGNISMITEILYFSLFNRIIFGNKIYSHHLFSMILISLCILGLYILLIIKYIKIETNEWDTWRDIIFPTILNFIIYLIFCCQLVKAKYYIEKYFISLYQLMLTIGTIGLILLLIFEPITFLIPCDNLIICYEGHFAGFISGFKSLSGLDDCPSVIIGIFLLFLTAFGLWLTVIYLSPSHFLSSDSIITFGINIIIDCYNDNLFLVNNPLFYVLSLLTILGCFIYNEIIIIKIFGLNYNTKKEILKRQNKEVIENIAENIEEEEVSNNDIELLPIEAYI